MLVFSTSVVILFHGKYCVQYFRVLGEPQWVWMISLSPRACPSVTFRCHWHHASHIPIFHPLPPWQRAVYPDELLCCVWAGYPCFERGQTSVLKGMPFGAGPLVKARQLQKKHQPLSWEAGKGRTALQTFGPFTPVLGLAWSTLGLTLA